MSDLRQRRNCNIYSAEEVEDGSYNYENIVDGVDDVDDLDDVDNLDCVDDVDHVGGVDDVDHVDGVDDVSHVDGVDDVDHVDGVDDVDREGSVLILGGMDEGVCNDETQVWTQHGEAGKSVLINIPQIGSCVETHCEKHAPDVSHCPSQKKKGLPKFACPMVGDSKDNLGIAKHWRADVVSGRPEKCPAEPLRDGLVDISSPVTPSNVDDHDRDHVQTDVATLPSRMTMLENFRREFGTIVEHLQGGHLEKTHRMHRKLLEEFRVDTTLEFGKVERMVNKLIVASEARLAETIKTAVATVERNLNIELQRVLREVKMSTSEKQTPSSTQPTLLLTSQKIPKVRKRAAPKGKSHHTSRKSHKVGQTADATCSIGNKADQVTGSFWGGRAEDTSATHISTEAATTPSRKSLKWSARKVQSGNGGSKVSCTQPPKKGAEFLLF